MTIPISSVNTGTGKKRIADPKAYLDSLEALSVKMAFHAFCTLKAEGRLNHGSGMFHYGDWAVSL